MGRRVRRGKQLRQKVEELQQKFDRTCDRNFSLQAQLDGARELLEEVHRRAMVEIDLVRSACRMSHVAATRPPTVFSAEVDVSMRAANAYLGGPAQFIVRGVENAKQVLADKLGVDVSVLQYVRAKEIYNAETDVLTLHVAVLI